MLKRLLPLATLALLGATVAGAQSSAAPKMSTGVAQAELIPAAPPQESVFRFVEQMPAFKGDVNSYLAEHLNYPEKARKAGAQGKVYVSFIITDKGLVKDVKMLRSSGNAELDAEALRVANAMNNPDGSVMWTAGRNNGVAVNTQFTLPVSFKLD